MNETPTTSTNADLARNLQALGNFLANVNTPIAPHVNGYGHNGDVEASWLLFGDGLALEEQKEAAQQIIRSIGGHWDKDGFALFRFTQQVTPGVTLKVIVEREAVCRRVVTGAREVTRDIPAVEAQPARTVTEVIEDVEWECEPVLTEAVSA